MLKNIFQKFRTAISWNKAIDMASEKRYHDARHILESIRQTLLFQHYDVQLFYAVVLYADREYESSFEQFIVALKTLSGSKARQDEKNYLYTAVKEYLTYLQEEVGKPFPNFGFHENDFDGNKISSRLKHLFPLS